MKDRDMLREQVVFGGGTAKYGRCHHVGQRGKSESQYLQTGTVKKGEMTSGQERAIH